MTDLWQIALLGTLRLTRGDRSITRFKYQKVGGLLAYLAFHKRQAHPREVLIELFWPESAPDTGRNNLSTALSSLRHQLEPPGTPAGAVLRADRYSVGVNPAAVATDVDAFEDTLQRARRAAGGERIGFLERAVALYAGPLLPGHYDDWIVAEQERLAGLFLDTLTELTALLERQGDLAGALRHARRAASAHPENEAVRARLARLQSAAGVAPPPADPGFVAEAPRSTRTLALVDAEPIATFPIARAALRFARERIADSPAARIALHTGEGSDGDAAAAVRALLGVARPGQILLGEATAALARRDLPDACRLTDRGLFRLGPAADLERLYQLDYPGMPEDGFGPPAAAHRHTGNLPASYTRFFGREAEIDGLAARLSPGAERLVTLTGPGGTGKTRLSLEVARRLADAYSGAVWFVALAELTQAEQIPAAVADALGVGRGGGDPREMAVGALSRQPSLLVLDNGEHLLDGVAALAREFLERVPTLALLVTSRQRLNLPGEREFPVPPLPTPAGPDSPERLSLYDSVALFLDRAQAAMPHFQITVRNAPAIAALCQRLEGLPLALELAASRAMALTPGQMLEQLSRRFDLLVTRQRGVSERHRSLQAAIDWSYRLLTPDVQRFFCRLSVLRGWFRVEDAEAVCEEPLAGDFLALLVECSMARVESTDAVLYFWQVETMHEFGDEQLSPPERAALEARFVRHFAHTPHQHELGWCFDRAFELARNQEDVDSHLRLASIMAVSWWRRSRLAEGRSYLQTALSRSGAEEPTEARALALDGLRQLVGIQGYAREARRFQEEIQRIWEARGAVERASQTRYELYGVGAQELAEGDYDQVERALRYRETLDGGAAYRNHHQWGRLEWARGNFAAARQHFTAALENRRLGNLEEAILSGVYLTADFLWLAYVALAEGNLDDACHKAREFLPGTVNWPQRRAEGLYILGLASARQGRLTEAAPCLRESLQTFHKIEMRRSVGGGLAALAEYESLSNRPERAVPLYAASAVLLEALGQRLPPWRQAEIDTELATLRASLGEAEFTAAWDAGQALDEAAAVKFALENDG